MSSQYWTTYIQGSYDIVIRAWDEFYNSSHEDWRDSRVEWEKEEVDDNYWLVTRTRTLDDYGNEGYQGEISHRRYQRLNEIIQDMEREQEERRLELEAEKRRREEEERARKNAAKDEIENAVREARKFLDSSEFESAERTLLASTRAYTTYSDELDFSSYKQMEVLIQQEKTQWMKNSIKNIEGLIFKKSWDDAKSIMDSIRTDRVSSTGFNDQFRKLRTNLNQAKKEWEEAERERLRLEKIANEKRALEMVEEAIKNWNPIISERNLLSNETGYLMFIADLKKSDDWSFLNEHDEWIKGSEKQLGKVAELSLHNAKDSLITTILERVVKNDISRGNILSNEIIGGEANPLEIADMLNVLKQGITDHFGELWKYISTNNYQIQDSVVEDFTILFVEARTAYVEEIIRSKNTEFAKAMVGRVLNLQEEDDFVTKVADSYIGEHEVRVFVDDENGNRQELFGDDIVKHIEQGSNLVIILEECYYTEQEKMHGHIKNRKIFEN